MNEDVMREIALKIATAINPSAFDDYPVSSEEIADTIIESWGDDPNHEAILRLGDIMNDEGGE